MDERMLGVAQAGKVDVLYALIQENPSVFESIDGLPFADSPLHIAASEGHVDFVMEMMILKPSFARKLNPCGFSPLHLALQNDRNLVVRELLRVDKDLVGVKGRAGLTSLHLAVEMGNLQHIAEFLKACPECIKDVTTQGHTALHIAVIHNNFEALKLLMFWLQRSTHKEAHIWEEEVFNTKDREGNTILHIAASRNHYQIVRLLIKSAKIKNEINLNHHSALEMLEGQDDTRKTARALRWGGYLKTEAHFKCQTVAESLRSEKEISWLEKWLTSRARRKNKRSTDDKRGLMDTWNNLMTQLGLFFTTINSQ
ncbi:hypothetical protein SLA2020_250790 [Shorea laevis]